MCPVNFWGLNLKLLLPTVCGLACIWMPEYLPAEWISYSALNSLGYIDWLDDLGAAHLTFPEESPKEKNQECRGWWGGSPDLSEWRRTKCKMYRIFFNTYFLSQNNIFMGKECRHRCSICLDWKIWRIQGIFSEVTPHVKFFSYIHVSKLYCQCVILSEYTL